MEESWSAGKYGEPAIERERPLESSGVERAKNSIADMLHNLAMTISSKTATAEARPQVAHYGRQASQMLEQSADYLREWDYEATEAQVRQYVKEKPGRSLLIAGIAGLVLGALMRRR
ncbi:MAG: hypothetical protein QME75_00005 [Deltaproteobacteria bacterium]|nr:hypothetical protein [Deltaproteobacteria bacterium]